VNNVRTALVLFFFSLSLTLAAQGAEPEEPGIILPPTLLEVEDLQVEEISAIIPEEEVQLLPEISIPLPQADEIFLPEERFDIPYPDQLAFTLGGASRGQSKANIFSEGEIAVGSMNHVRGDLTLYRLGPDPRFDLRFYHDKIDGYGLRSAGSGYYHSDDLLEGSISLDANGVGLAAQAGITESSEGLQGISEFESLTYRRVYGDATIQYPPVESLLLTGSLGTSYAQQILSSAEPDIEDELDLHARVGLGLSTRYVDLETTIGYLLVDSALASHSLELTLSSSFKINDTLLFGVSAAAIWDRLATFRFPFSATGLWQPSDSFAFEIEGGYFVEFPTYGGLRDEYIFIDLKDTIGSEYGWFAYADTQIRILRSLILTADVDFKYFDLGYQVHPDHSQVTGLFPLEAKLASPWLQTGIDLSYDISRAFNFSISWAGRFIGSDPYRPAHLLETGFSYQNPSDVFGGGIDLSMPLTATGTIMPELDVSVFYRLSESVKLRLDVADPLAPLLPEGRALWAPYKAPGFHIFLGTNISL
jgi:hypothetical protein